MDQPGTFMLMIKHASLMLGVSETSVKMWGGQGRLPCVRIEIANTTLFPLAYIEALRENAAQRQTFIGAALLDTFNSNPTASSLQETCRQAFLGLLERPQLNAQDLAELFGLNDMVLARWEHAGLIHSGVVQTVRLFQNCHWRPITPNQQR